MRDLRLDVRILPEPLRLQGGAGSAPASAEERRRAARGGWRPTCR
ncbi:hypothetical protein ACPA9J_14630 [Pseudomonas aeruginosa]